MEGVQTITLDLQACLEAFEGEPSGLANAVAHLMPAQRPTPSEVARLFCHGDASQAKLTPGEYAQAHWLLFGLLRSLPAEEVLPYLGQLTSHCQALDDPYFVMPLVHSLTGYHRDWTPELSAALTGQALFHKSTGPAYLAVAAQLALQDDARALGLLAQGARGIWGGSSRLLQRAAALQETVLLRKNPCNFNPLESIRQSKYVQKRHRLGSILAASYALPNAWPSGDPSPAIAALDALLDDERFQRDASFQILSSTERPGADRLGQAPLWENAAWPNLVIRAQRLNANFLAGFR